MTRISLSAISTAAASTLLAGAAQAQAPSTCIANQTTGSVVIADQIPCDYKDGDALGAAGLSNFAWNTFIAMNWPAEDPFAAPYDRGVPDANSKIGAPGQPGEDTPIVVWDSWREKRELFVIRDNAGSYMYVAPQPFNDGQPPSTTGPNPQIAACTGAAPPPAGHITALQTNKVENYLDETDEIGLAILWAGTDTAELTEETLVRYQVKFNYEHYEDIRTKQWWNPSTLTAAIGAEQTSGNGAGVVLTSGSNAAGTPGAILTKSAWKLLDQSEIDGGTYYTQSSIFYETENGEPCYGYGTFGLVGLHIIRKTDHFPYLFFSTFEHNGNYPGAFTYANTNAQGPSAGTFAASQTNPFGIAYRNPADPAPNPSVMLTPGYPATRLLKKLPEVDAANASVAAMLSGTVWANYSLVGFQSMPTDPPADYMTGGYYQQGGPAGSGGNDGYFPPYFADQDYYLANAVIETSQRFQFFTGSFSAATDNNIIMYPNNDPNGNAGGKQDFSINMGGCMGCHGRGQATGFSFTLGGAKAEPKTFSAETLSDKCAGEDGGAAELFASFDDATGICTLNK